MDSEPERREPFELAVSAFSDTFLLVQGEDGDARFGSPLVQRGIPSWLELLDEQLRAHCKPDEGEVCEWARSGLVADATELLEMPIVATSVDLFEAVREDTRARDELLRFFAYLLESTSPHGAHAATLATLLDTLQVAAEPGALEPLYQWVADAMAPQAPGRDAPGAVAAAIEVLTRFVAPGYDEAGRRTCSSQLDPHRVVGWLLERAVTPDDSGRAPWSAFTDAARSVNRAEPGSDAIYREADFQNLAEEFTALLLDESGGLEQLYTVVRQATEER